MNIILYSAMDAGTEGVDEGNKGHFTYTLQQNIFVCSSSSISYIARELKNQKVIKRPALPTQSN